MTTKLGLFCDKVIEAGWLAALIVAPLFFNFHSSNVFDPDKSCVIRSIALVMLLAFIIRLLEGKHSFNVSKKISGSKSQPLTSNTTFPLRHPVFICTLLIGVCYLISTLLSVTPHNSWWGSYARLQGSYTLVSYLVIFFITALTLRSPQQFHRIITTIILTSFPVVIYGLGQRFRLDPLSWDADFVSRIASSLGNPIFLGGYLVMVIPLTLGRLISTSKILNHKSQVLTSILFYLLLLILQIAALILTQSRGPVVGFMVGIFLFIVLFLSIKRYKKTLLLVYGGTIILILFLIILNIPKGPLEPLRKTPYLGRLSQVFETREGGSGKIRLLMWEGVINMVQADPSRALVGYGPEILFVPIHKYAPPQLVRYEGRIAFPDRAHNEFFDMLAGTGLIGLGLYLTLFGLISFYTLRYLGLIKNRTHSLVFLILCLLGISAGILVPWLVQGNLVFSGIGIPLGLIMATGGYLLFWTLGIRQSSESVQDAADKNFPAWEILIISLFSALAAHFIEIQFGINLTATRTYFWIFTACFISLPLIVRHPNRGNIPIPESANSAKTQKKRKIKEPHNSSTPQFFSFSVYPLIMGLILSVLIYDLVTVSFLSTHFWTAKRLGFVIAFVLMWLLSGIFISSQQSTNRWILDTGLYLLISGGYAIAFIILYSLFLPPMRSPVNTITIFYLWLFLWIIFTGYWIPTIEYLPNGVAREETTSGSRSSSTWATSFGRASSIKYPLLRWGNSLVYLVLIIAVGLIILFTNLNPLRGNIFHKMGSSLERRRDWDGALRHYDTAIKLSADPTYYYASVARVYLVRYQSETDPQKKAQWSKQCLEYLLKSLEYDSYSPTRHANLGRFYRALGRTETQSALRNEQFAKAYHHYQLAHSLSPHDPRLMNEWGEAYHEGQDYQKAIEIYQQSLKIDKTFAETYAHLGDVYLESRNIPKMLEYYEQAAYLYFESHFGDIRGPNERILLDRTHAKLIQYRPDFYLGYYNLAFYHYARRDLVKADEMAQKALFLTPPEKRPALENLIQQLKQE